MIALAKEYEAKGKLIIIAPEDTFGVDTLTREAEPMLQLYKKGYRDGVKIQDFVSK